MHRRIWILFLLLPACTTLFGWDIHAPGILSENFYTQVQQEPERVALYLPDHLIHYTSKERGGKLADPQTYYVGESFVPMLVEAFQAAFDEFILIETEPTAEILAQYAIPYLVVVDIHEFQNRVTLKGQAVGIRTSAWIFDQNLHLAAQLEADGSSDAQKVFAKKGGPEVNLNAAAENNITAFIQLLQDLLKNQLS